MNRAVRKNKLAEIIIHEYGKSAQGLSALEASDRSHIRLFRTMMALLVTADEVAIYRLIGEYEKARIMIMKAHEDLRIEYETNTALCEQLDLLLTDHECNLHWEVGEYQKVFESARRMLELSRSVLDTRSEAEAMNMLGLAYQSQGDYDEAIGHFKQSYDKSQDLKDGNFSATVLNNIGDLYYEMGDLPRSYEYFKEGLKLIEGTDNLKNLAIGLNNLGSISYMMNQSNTALDYYLKAYDLSRKVGDRRNEAILTNNIGTIYDQLGRIRTSLEYYDKALAIQESIGDMPGVATTMNNMGYGYMELQEYDKALEYLSKCKDLWIKSGYRRGEIVSGKNIAHVYIMQNNYNEAVKIIAQLEANLKEIPDQEYEKQTVRLKGMIEISKRDPAAARLYAERLEFIAKSSKKESDRADALVLLGQILYMEGALDMAMSKFSEALDIYSRSKLQYKVAETEYIFASAIMKHDLEKANSLLMSAIRFFKNAGAPKWVEECEKLTKQ